MFGVESTFTSPSTWSACRSAPMLRNSTPLNVNVPFTAPTVRPFTFARPAGLLSASRNGGDPCQERRYYLRGVLGVRVLEIVNIDLALALRRGNVEGAQKALDLFYVMHRIGDDEGVGR